MKARDFIKRVQADLIDLGRALAEGSVTAEEALDQQIREAAVALERAQQGYNAAKASRLDAQDELAQARTRLAELEEQVTRLLRGRRKTLARERARQAEIASQQVAEWEQALEGARQAEATYSDAVAQKTRDLRHLKYQMGTLRAQENLKRAQESLVQETGQQGESAMDVARRAQADRERKPKVATTDAALSRAESANQIIERLERALRREKKPRKQGKNMGEGK